MRSKKEKRSQENLKNPKKGLDRADKSKPYGIKAGVIGTETGIKCFERWVEWVQRPVLSATPLLGRPPFPGFETVFQSRWNTKPLLTLTITDAEIDEHLYLDEPHLRVYGTVSVFAKRILEAIRGETENPELWFVVVPDRVWKYCRPDSVVEPEVRQQVLRGKAPGVSDIYIYIYKDQGTQDMRVRGLRSFGLGSPFVAVVQASQPHMRKDAT